MSSSPRAIDGHNFREEIRQAVVRGELDVDDVLAVGNELARSDLQKARFLVDASHISRLGLELVARQETAVAELVKNGYDADATHVDLIFRHSSEPRGSLEIIDNGTGMDHAELVNGFMRLSTADKVENPISLIYKRQRAGRKGIGRFAAQRLGNRLTVITQTESSHEALKVSIDWGRFTKNVDLSSISNSIQRIDKRAAKGTTLLIEDLRDSWSEAQIRRAYRYVADLLQPLPLTPIMARPQDDPGFKAAFYRAENDDLIVIADEDTAVFQHAVSIIEGWVDSYGVAYWSVHAPRLAVKEEGKPLDAPRSPDLEDPGEARYRTLRDVRFKAYYFVQDPEFIPRGDFGAVRSMLTQKGGIRLYRNGFRVVPYGDQFNDWLRLDAASRAREVFAPFANTSFLGFVEIFDSEGVRFEETSSREGLVENEPFHELRDFVFRALRSGVMRVAEARGRRATKSGQRRKAERPPQEVAQEMVRLLNEAQPSGAEVAFEVDAVERLRAGIAELGAFGQSLLQEAAMLRVLASLGLSIGEFTHEIRTSLGASILDVTRLKERLSGTPEQKLAEAARST
jgi:Histidine kinase-, DNA gyrase B-, and HSP90-like ATPase